LGQCIYYGVAKFWLLIQDEYTNYCWNYFLSAKSNLSAVVIQHIKTFQKEHDFIPKYVRLENAGENKTVQQEAENDPKLNLICEFTAPYTPQQNRKI
jgi:hypothetical protein